MDTMLEFNKGFVERKEYEAPTRTGNICRTESRPFGPAWIRA